MNTFLLEPAARQLEILRQAHQLMRLPVASIEKDFWVCWTLRALMQQPEVGGCLTFKGGTSLSKAWGLIERFSEDLDLVVDKDALGCAGENLPERAKSGKQRERRLQELRTACQQWVRGTVQPHLATQLAALPVGRDGSVEEAVDDPDGSTLVVHFPTVVQTEGTSYVRPEVRLEFGARSDVEPQQVRRVSSYIHEHLPLLDPDTFCAVRVLAPERTFWEKACLLHEENTRPQPRGRPRLSRHFYDLWCLIRAGVGERAIEDRTLFDRVVAHRRVYFRQSWLEDAAYASGAFRLVPSAERIPIWRADYDRMKESMFFGEAPEFDELLRGIEELETRVHLTGLRPKS